MQLLQKLERGYWSVGKNSSQGEINQEIDSFRVQALRIRVDILENCENFKFIVKTLQLRVDFFKNVKNTSKKMFVYLQNSTSKFKIP